MALSLSCPPSTSGHHWPEMNKYTVVIRIWERLTLCNECLTSWHCKGFPLATKTGVISIKEYYLIDCNSAATAKFDWLLWDQCPVRDVPIHPTARSSHMLPDLLNVTTVPESQRPEQRSCHPRRAARNLSVCIVCLITQDRQWCVHLMSYKLHKYYHSLPKAGQRPSVSWSFAEQEAMSFGSQSVNGAGRVVKYWMTVSASIETESWFLCIATAWHKKAKHFHVPLALNQKMDVGFSILLFIRWIRLTGPSQDIFLTASHHAV